MRVTALMTNGERLEADVILADRVSYSTTARRHGWATNPQEDPIMFGYFTTFAAIRREGKFSGGWEEFTNNCSDIDIDGDDEYPTVTESGDA